MLGFISWNMYFLAAEQEACLALVIKFVIALLLSHLLYSRLQEIYGLHIAHIHTFTLFYTSIYCDIQIFIELYCGY